MVCFSILILIKNASAQTPHCNKNLEKVWLCCVNISFQCLQKQKKSVFAQTAFCTLIYTYDFCTKLSKEIVTKCTMKVKKADCSTTEEVEIWKKIGLNENGHNLKIL